MNKIGTFFITLFLFSLLICSCSYAKKLINKTEFIEFTGMWKGNGIDSKGNTFSFVAEVSRLADNKYRIVISDKIDSDKEPFHIIEGTLNNNKFTSTADGGKYKGGGKLSQNLYEGYYKGPVNGTYTMQRIKS